MDDEVGSYLLNQFKCGLQSSKVSWKSDLQDLEKLIQRNIENSPAEEKPSLREKLYRLNNILVECQAASFLSCKGIISLWRIRNNLKEIKEELKSKDSSTISSNGNSSPQRDDQGNSSNVRDTARQSHQSVSPLVVHGFDDEITSLVKLLVYERSEEKFSAVGITGMADKEKCWLIFKDAVEQGGARFNPPNVELEDLKKEIIRKCSGLPLAARVLGEIMKEKMEEAPAPNGHTVTVQPELSTDSNSNV
ncbi:hypothetical protein NC653_027189 [Populus alba x Populus x berolinensis]|uniref:NB-ARC domain-containing protein n=1 Tax=Populus alba x Populus x berolinensis TaxID=444605 RepID=A0AAD6M7D2_9ROSI|nr:hypothetical protein NC653_027189 [Populus alba x Populus x berolinensis]